MLKKLFTVLIWVPSAVVLVFGSIQLFISYSRTKAAPALIRQEISSLKQNRVGFAGIPNLSFEIKTAFATQDARPILIERYFTRYNSPMAGYGEYIVNLADGKGVDPYLVIAIAQQESNLGKLMPPACHNAWGWGIHSAGTLCFDTWEEGISTFIIGLADKYHAYGLITPEEIMTKYNANSPEGAWAKGVSYFLEQLNSGNF